MNRTLWRRFIALGFHLLYNELAFLYDPVSWLASLGRWRAWQESLLSFLPRSGRILEVGFGPGHLLADLGLAGYSTVGVDLSPAMLRLAQRRLCRLQLHVPLCRSRAQSLPFAGQTFDSVVLTFPTPFVYDPAWLQQVSRVLEPGGRLIVVEMASFDQRTLPFQLLEWLYRVTGQRGPTPDLLALLSDVGLDAHLHAVVVRGTTGLGPSLPPVQH
jgi:ubiquinone/menaquinone biosynthesis C-methylase UbiE